MQSYDLSLKVLKEICNEIKPQEDKKLKEIDILK